MKHNKSESLTSARYIEWQASLFGACFVAFGLGAWFGNYFTKVIPWVILIGIGLHGWGMYQIHRRNK